MRQFILVLVRTTTLPVHFPVLTKACHEPPYIPIDRLHPSLGPLSGLLFGHAAQLLHIVEAAMCRLT